MATSALMRLTLGQWGREHGPEVRRGGRAKSGWRSASHTSETGETRPRQHHLTRRGRSVWPHHMVPVSPIFVLLRAHQSPPDMSCERVS